MNELGTRIPNLRKTPRGGKIMAKMISMQVAAVIFLFLFVGKKSSKLKLVTDDDDDDDPITKLMWCVVLCDRRKCKEKHVNI